MLDTETKRRIDSARDILVGKVPDPKSQVEQITIARVWGEETKALPVEIDAPVIEQVKEARG